MSFVYARKQEAIPPGYQLYINTWENDGDHSSTQIISGLTKEDTIFYIELCHLFKSKNSPRDKDCFGNDGCKIEDLKEAVSGVLLNHFKKLSDKTRTLFIRAISDEECNDDCEFCKQTTCPGGLHELLCEKILGYTTDYYDYPNFCRVFEDFKVFYIPEKAEEVTHEFKKEK